MADTYISEVKNAPKEVQKLKDQIDLVDRAKSEVESLYPRISGRKEDSATMREWVDLLIERTGHYNSLMREIREDYRVDKKLIDRLKYPLRCEQCIRHVQEVTWYLEILNMFLQIVQVKLGFQVRQSSLSVEFELATVKTVIEAEQSRGHFISALNELSTETYKIHDKLLGELEKCQSTEPRWVLDQPAFQKWRSLAKETEDKDTSPWLWGIGPPGAGKTCIASFVADALRDPEPAIQDDSLYDVVRPLASNAQAKKIITLPSREYAPPHGTAVAVFYCNYRSSGDQTIDSIFRCLCRQFIEHLRNVNHWKARKRLQYLDRVLQPYTYQGAGDQLDMQALLRMILKDFEHSYVIVDALDELQDQEMCENLLAKLKDLSSIPSLRIFLTSRSSDDMNRLANHLCGSPFTVKPGEEEIRCYVTSMLEHMSARGRGLGAALPDLIQDEKQRLDIAEKIASASDGSYLCAELQLKILGNVQGQEDLQYRLQNLPQSLSGLLDDTITRIKMKDQSMGHPLGPIGEKTFVWVMYAEFELTAVEISHALLASLGRNDSSFTKRSPNLPTTHQLMESTCNCLSIDSSKGTIQVHKALRDYCSDLGEERESQIFGQFHFEMARACLRYLANKEISGHSASEEEWQKHLELFPFLTYAANNWGKHLKQCQPRFLRNGEDFSILDILEQEDDVVVCMARSLQSNRLYTNLDPNGRNSSLYRIPISKWIEVGPGDTSLMPPLHLLAYFNLDACADLWLKEVDDDVESMSRDKITALWVACEQGHDSMVRRLLKHGADLGYKNSKGRFCLHIAISHGHEDVVNTLLKHKHKERYGQILLRQQDRWGRSPLQVAVAKGNEIILKKLLTNVAQMPDRDSLISHGDYYSRNLLHEAAINDTHLTIPLVMGEAGSQELLLQRTKEDVAMDRRVGAGNTPLHIAAAAGHDKALSVLLQYNIDMDAREADGCTPLRVACTYASDGHLRVTQTLLSKGASPALVDNLGNNAFHAAARVGCWAQICQLLRPHRPDFTDTMLRSALEARNSDGLTPLYAAWVYRASEWRQVISEFLEIGTAPVPSKLSTLPSKKAVTQRDGSPMILTSEPIPTSVRLPVFRLGFRISAHDQGFADDWPWDKDTYHNSETWFEVVRIGVDGAQIGPVRMLTLNLRARWETHTHSIEWDVGYGDLGGGSRGKGEKMQNIVKKFVRDLQHGERVGIVARARYPGWVNYIEAAECKVWFTEETPQAEEEPIKQVTEGVESL